MRFEQATTVVAVMSYNRGKYLANCIASIERFLPRATIRIYDDSSDGPVTVGVLQQLAQKHAVIRCDDTPDGDRGGLHGNMNRAVDDAVRDGFGYVHFVQDDMQFVREPDCEFEADINRMFAEIPGLAQVETTFFKGYWTSRQLRDRYAPHSELPCYLPSPEHWHTGIVDTGIISLESIRKTAFRFSSTEAASIIDSARHGLRRVAARNPVLAFLPWPAKAEKRSGRAASWRSRLRDGIVTFQEWVVAADCHPLEYMTETEIADLKNRAVDRYPIAEEFLRTRRALRRPWWYSGCENVSDFKYPWRLLTGAFLKGPPHYRRNVSAQRKQEDQYDVIRSAAAVPRSP